uniref:Uncharacterized protein n=1 Tax=uncultured Desulfobacterales bacterium HF0200_07G10 TaxID=710741 RepID=E0XU39_9BACT|nr:hypothetical protein [uncultured Desulfobacterales bacterium HF0200_07G10]
MLRPSSSVDAKESTASPYTLDQNLNPQLLQTIFNCQRTIAPPRALCKTKTFYRTLQKSRVWR